MYCAQRCTLGVAVPSGAAGCLTQLKTGWHLVFLFVAENVQVVVLNGGRFRGYKIGK
jgi:hypothetical protein